MLEVGTPEPRIARIARELEEKSGMKFADFGYTPEDYARIYQLDGIKKIRGVMDRSLARQLWDLYWICEAREVTGDAERYRREKRAQEEKDEHEILEVFAKCCLSGGRGDAAKQLATEMLVSNGRQRDDLESYRALMREFKSLPKRLVRDFRG
jgi:hypothetical protein